MASQDSLVDAPELSHAEIRRYSRHLILADIGMDGQRRLKASSVLCIGSGGLGSPVLMYLAAAGIGTLGVVDDDVVDESNLQRQIVHSTDALGTPKVESARERVRQINPHVRVVAHHERVSASNALEMFAPYDLVVDGCDNFPTRYLVNDACAACPLPAATRAHRGPLVTAAGRCVILGKPLVYGAVQVRGCRGGATLLLACSDASARARRNSRASCRCSITRAARITETSSRSRQRRAQSRHAPRAACSACSQVGSPAPTPHGTATSRFHTVPRARQA